MAQSLLGCVSFPKGWKAQSRAGREESGEGSILPAAVPRKGASGAPGGHAGGRSRENPRKEAGSWMGPCKHMAGCGQWEGGEKEVLALTLTWTRGGDRQVTVSKSGPGVAAAMGHQGGDSDGGKQRGWSTSPGSALGHPVRESHWML